MSMKIAEFEMTGGARHCRAPYNYKTTDPDEYCPTLGRSPSDLREIRASPFEFSGVRFWILPVCASSQAELVCKRPALRFAENPAR
jgi:hypothetical protein